MAVSGGETVKKGGREGEFLHVEEIHIHFALLLLFSSHHLESEKRAQVT